MDRAIALVQLNLNGQPSQGGVPRLVEHHKQLRYRCSEADLMIELRNVERQTFTEGFEPSRLGKIISLQPKNKADCP